MSKHLPSVSGGEFLLYQTEDGRSRIEVRMQSETVWLTINQMAELFQVDKSAWFRNGCFWVTLAGETMPVTTG